MNPSIKKMNLGHSRKPRVFLSHSKKDSQFIEKLERAFRKCQIEPWLDTFEIRHGKPWLEAIFKDGIPSCDSVIVYLTPHSLRSLVVKKELDASVISQLHDNSIGLLPYVDKDTLRNDVRVDLKALQIPEWNNENFDSVLPQCVAEIWRSFHEREALRLVSAEMFRRTEAEKALKLERNRRQSTYCGITY